MTAGEQLLWVPQQLLQPAIDTAPASTSPAANRRMNMGILLNYEERAA